MRGGEEKGGDGERERVAGKTEEGRMERKWHPVKLKKIACRTKLNLSATPSEMKGDFDTIISFHLSLSSPRHSSVVYTGFFFLMCLHPV